MIPIFFKKHKKFTDNPLLAELLEAQTELDGAYSDFELALDPDLIDSAIFQMNAVLKRYHFILRSLHSAEDSTL
jgi:hypothetical protein